MSKRQASGLALDSIVRRVKAFRKEEEEKRSLSRSSSASSLLEEEEGKTAIQCLVEDILYLFTGGELVEQFLSCTGWFYLDSLALALSTKRTWLGFRRSKLYIPFECPANELSESNSICAWGHKARNLVFGWNQRCAVMYSLSVQPCKWECDRRTNVLELAEQYQNWLLCPHHLVKGCQDCVGEDHIEGTVCVLCTEDEDKDLDEEDRGDLKEDSDEEDGEDEDESESEEEEEEKEEDNEEEDSEEEKEDGEDSDVEVIGEVRGLSNRENPIVIEDDDDDDYAFDNKAEARACERVYRNWMGTHKDPIYIDGHLINV